MTGLRAKLLIACALILLAVGCLAVYLAVAVGNELYEARATLSGRATELDSDTLRDARRHLAEADRKLGGRAARLLSLVPFARQSVRAVEEVTEKTIPVVDAADALVRKLDAIRSLDVVESGKIRLDLVAQLRGDLVRQTAALEELVVAASEARSGWLPPPLWDALDDLARRASGYLDSARRGLDAVELMPPMLGRSGPRTYLVVLVNNAELRGAGGIPSAAGTITAVEGRMTLGRFHHTVDLRGPRPYERLPAPADFRRRFGFYGADTTFWTNTTFSPDVPDVALVAARAFARATGTRVDGVLVVDPRGMAALMPEDATVRVRGTGAVITRGELADYVFSGVYADLGGATEGRRRALLQLGQATFRSILDGGALTATATVEDAGRAVAGGHIRVVSFDPAEQRALDRVDASGDLGRTKGDSLLVAAQNFSADKLGYWVRRDISHSCTIEPRNAACTASVTFTNEAPDGLTRYVAGKPYGVLEDLVEVYLPEDATLGPVRTDGRPVGEADRQDGHHVVGAFFELAPGTSRTLSVSYDLPLGPEGYSLEVLPQPLARDARLLIALDAPRTWAFSGEGETSDGTLRFEGALDRTVRVAARPRDRSGLPALWEAVVGFWEEPLF